MSIKDVFEYKQNEYQDLTKIEQAIAGTADVNFDYLGLDIAGYNINIFDDAVGTTQLILDTDYNLLYEDEKISALESVSVFAGYKIINAAYQSIPLYLDIRCVGGYTKFTGGFYQSVDTTQTITPQSFVHTVYGDTASGNITLTVDDAPRLNDKMVIVNTAGFIINLTMTGTSGEEVPANSARTFLWVGAAWYLVSDGIDGVSVVWQGSQVSPPATPSLNWGYYDTVLKKSYIYDGTSWQIMAIDGVEIVWKGSLAIPPADPELNWAYYDTVLKKSYIYNGTSWMILTQDGADGIIGVDGIGGGHVLGEGYWFAGAGLIPDTSVLADGSLLLIVDYPALANVLGTIWGGDGSTTFGVPNLQGIHPGMIGTSVINTRTKGDVANAIGDYVEDKIQDHSAKFELSNDYTDANGDIELITETAGTEGGLIVATGKANSTQHPLIFDGVKEHAGNGTPRIDDFTDVSQAMGRWVIQAFNDNIQEIPADPALIKDWVEKLDTPQTVYAAVTNSWGSGKYLVMCDSGGNMATYIIDVDIDKLSAGKVAFSATTDYTANRRVLYSFTANTFTNEASYPFVSIKRWEDVAGADAQLNPPIDGWETIWEGTPTTPVTNSWGAGRYEIITDTFTGTADTFVAELSLTAADIAASAGAVWTGELSRTSGDNSIGISYSKTSNTFNVVGYGTYSGNIVRIRKFNSLVNVLHTYKLAATQDTAFPSNPTFADECYRTDLDKWYKYNGTVWTQI